MRLSLLIDFLAYSNKQKTNDPGDLVRIKKQYDESDASEITRYFPRKVTDGTTDEDVPLPDANTDFMLLFTDQEISIKLNGSSDAIVLKPSNAGVKTPAFMLKGDLTDLKVSNSSGSDANLDINLVQI